MKVTIYTKSTCPYCHMAKDLLAQKGYVYTEIDYPTLGDNERATLAQKTNHYRTVPQIFLGDEFIGGFSDLQALDNAGKLPNAHA